MTPTEIIKLSDGNKETMQYLFGLQGEMNEALAKFRSQLKAPDKNGKVNYKPKRGPKIDYSYVKLDDLIKAIDAAAKNTGITWRQSDCTKDVQVNKSGYNNTPYQVTVKAIMVTTVIKYKNGWQAASDKTELTASSTDPQDVGSALTYAKRYSLATAFGINANSDNDYADFNQYDKQASYQSKPSTSINENYQSQSYQQSPQRNNYQPANNMQQSNSNLQNNRKPSNNQISFLTDLFNRKQVPKNNDSNVQNYYAQISSIVKSNAVGTMNSDWVSQAITFMQQLQG